MESKRLTRRSCAGAFQTQVCAPMLFQTYHGCVGTHQIMYSMHWTNLSLRSLGARITLLLQASLGGNAVLREVQCFHGPGLPSHCTSMLWA